jgi:two-component sensor histidine kinase
VSVQVISKKAASSIAPEFVLSSGAAELSLNAHPSSRTYWLCQLAGWGAYALFATVSFGPNAPADFLKIVAINIWAALCGLALSHGWRAFIKRRAWFAEIKRAPWGWLVACIVLLGLLQTVLVSLGFAVTRPSFAMRSPESISSWAWIPNAVLTWIAIFSGWTTIYSYVLSSRRAKRIESEALRFEILAKDAELRALQAQINPHFFFNSLNSVRALIYESPDAAAKMVDQLAALMRYTLSSGNKTTVDLCDELEAVRAYLAIEKIRFEERLRAVFDIEPDLDNVQIPPMALQTLVENAVKYGVERNAAASEIRITIKNLPEAVSVEVANQGALVRLTDSTQLGLENSRKRLALLNHEGSHLTLIERDGWVIATLRLRRAP